MGPTLRFLLGAIIVGSACAPDSAVPRVESLCEPGANIFCRCRDGSAGTKQCNPDGSTFKQCSLDEGTECPKRRSGEGGRGGSGAAGGFGAEPAGPGGEGGAGNTGNPGPGGSGPLGSKKLLAACEEDADCEEGACPMGFCTRPCQAITDCPIGEAECVKFAAYSLCLPSCGPLESPEPDACGKYADTVECGYAVAIDKWPVATCAGWGTFLELPPQGTECSATEWGSTQCNLGHEGVESVCSDTDICVSGCFDDTDCPSDESCGGDSFVGECF